MSETYRVRRRTLLTPVRVHQHPGTGQQVTLVGTMHAGSAAYYRQLHEVVTHAARAGAVVCHEGMRDHLDTARRHATPAEGVALQALADFETLSRRRAHDLGWVYQPDILTDPGWTNIDLSPLDIIRKVGADAFSNYFHTVTRPLDWPEHDRAAVHRFRIQFRLSATASANPRFAALAAHLRPDGPVDTAIVEGRNKTAMAAVARADGAVVLIWGAAHLPGIEHALAQDGFHQHAETWHAVGRLPSLTNAAIHLLWHARPTRSAKSMPAVDEERVTG